MRKKTEQQIRTWWGGVALGVMLLLAGFLMIRDGIIADITGEIIPQTGKTGSMTGIESIITGSVTMFAGFVFLSVEAIRAYRRRRLHWALRERNNNDRNSKETITFVAFWLPCKKDWSRKAWRSVASGKRGVLWWRGSTFWKWYYEPSRRRVVDEIC